MKDSTTCAVDGCDRPAQVLTCCRGHYQRIQRRGHPGPAKFRRRPGTDPLPCKYDDCDRDHEAKGFCVVHYNRWRSGADMDAPLPPLKPARVAPCKIDGCDEPISGRGWCGRHYQRWWRTGDPGDMSNPRVGLLDTCSAEGCDREHRTGGYCDMHYRRFKRGVPPNSLRFLTPPPTFNRESYAAVHQRLARERGPAREHLCACGAVGHSWAYQHNDPQPLLSGLGAPYSPRIYDCYKPMCRPCHAVLDYDLDEQARRASARS